MMTGTQQAVLSDETFIAQFEDQSLPVGYFNHIGHLRISWLYLKQFEIELAVSKVCDGIKAYAESLGASTKFHLTLTDAIVRIMALRINAEQCWLSFLASNNDLVTNAISVINQHYSKAVLDSEQARFELIQPDIKAIL